MIIDREKKNLSEIWAVLRIWRRLQKNDQLTLDTLERIGWSADAMHLRDTLQLAKALYHSADYVYIPKGR